MLKRWYLVFVAFILFLFSTTSVFAVRIKDISNISGVRKNQLIGYGLVIGLEGTGDSSTNIFYVVQSITTMLSKLGVTIPPEQTSQLKAKNIATIIATAELPPFSRVGNKIDVLISSIGDAKSLKGGTLIFTPLKGADDNIYAIAQGPVSIGGVQTGALTDKEQKNHLTVGKILGGATIEKEISYHFEDNNQLSLILYKPDFTTSARASESINREFNRIIAKPRDGGTIDIAIPDIYKERYVEFITRLESISVNPDTTAKVVIDERTGTVVIGEDVKISPVAIAHGVLTVQIKEKKDTDQEATAAVRRIRGIPGEDVKQEKLMVIEGGISIKSLVNALNAIGVKPKDLIVIFQTIKAAGALHADLEII